MATFRNLFAVHDVWSNNLKTGDLDDELSIVWLNRVSAPGTVTVFITNDEEGRYDAFVARNQGRYPNLRIVGDGDPELCALWDKAGDVVLCAPVTFRDHRLQELLVYRSAGKQLFMQGTFDRYNFEASSPEVQAALRQNPALLQYSSEETNRWLSCDQLLAITGDAAFVHRMMRYAVLRLICPPCATDTLTKKISLTHRLYVDHKEKPGFAGNNLKNLFRLRSIDLGGRNASVAAADYFLGASSSSDPVAEALALPAVRALLATPSVKAYLETKDAAGVELQDWQPEMKAKLLVGFAFMTDCALQIDWAKRAYETDAMLPDKSTPYFDDSPQEDLTPFANMFSSPQWDFVTHYLVLAKIAPGTLSRTPQQLEPLVFDACVLLQK